MNRILVVYAKTLSDILGNAGNGRYFRLILAIMIICYILHGSRIRSRFPVLCRYRRRSQRRKLPCDTVRFSRRPRKQLCRARVKTMEFLFCLSVLRCNNVILTRYPYSTARFHRFLTNGGVRLFWVGGDDGGER